MYEKEFVPDDAYRFSKVGYSHMQHLNFWADSSMAFLIRIFVTVAFCIWTLSLQCYAFTVPYSNVCKFNKFFFIFKAACLSQLWYKYTEETCSTLINHSNNFFSCYDECAFKIILHH